MKQYNMQKRTVVITRYSNNKIYRKHEYYKRKEGVIELTDKTRTDLN